MGICLNLTLIAWLEFELADYDSVVQNFNNYTMKTPPPPTYLVVKQKMNLLKEFSSS